MRLFTLVLSLVLFANVSSFAQWLDNSNKFNDSLHMPVSVAPLNQQRTIVMFNLLVAHKMGTQC
jgi:hypothetical protein